MYRSGEYESHGTIPKDFLILGVTETFASEFLCAMRRRARRNTSKTIWDRLKLEFSEHEKVLSRENQNKYSLKTNFRNAFLLVYTILKWVCETTLILHSLQYIDVIQLMLLFLQLVLYRVVVLAFWLTELSSVSTTGVCLRITTLWTHSQKLQPQRYVYGIPKARHILGNAY